MSGVVELVLTDHELQLILDWYWMSAQHRSAPMLAEMQLAERLARYKHVLECPSPMICAPRDLDPNAP